MVRCEGGHPFLAPGPNLCGDAATCKRAAWEAPSDVIRGLETGASAESHAALALLPEDVSHRRLESNKGTR